MNNLNPTSPEHSNTAEVVNGAAVQAERQQDLVTQDLVLAAFRNDPRISKLLGAHFAEKSSLSPADVFNEWVTDGAAQLEEYLAFPEAERQLFWESDDSLALRAKLDRTKKLLEPSQVMEQEEDPVAEAEACFALLDVECPIDFEPQAIAFLAQFATQVNLMEQDLPMLGQLVQGYIYQQIISSEDETKAAENEIQAAENEVRLAENKVQAEIIERLKDKVGSADDNLTLDDIDSLLSLEGWEFVEDEVFLGYKVQLEAIRGTALSVQNSISPEEDPAAYAALSNILATQSFNWQETDPQSQFSGVLEEINNSKALTADQKNAISAQLGVPTAVIQTGSDIQDVLTTGYIDPTTGVRQSYTAERPRQIDPDTFVYEKNDGTRIVSVKLPDGRDITADFSATTGGAKVGQIAYTVRMMYAAERLNIAEPIFQRGWNITHGGEIDLHYDDLIRARNLGQIFVGGESGYDGLILDEGRINGLRHRFQALSSDGDERSWTNNPEQATQDLKELGLVDNSGEIVWSQFEKAGHYLLRIESEGGIPDFGLLREFLNNESPEEAGNSDL